MSDVQVKATGQLLTVQKVLQLAKFGIVGVHLGSSRCRVYVRDQAGEYLTPAADALGGIMDALDSVGCQIYYGDVVPSARGTNATRRAMDEIAFLKAIQENTRGLARNEITLVYVDSKMVPSVRTIVPIRLSTRFNDAIEAQCGLRGEERTFTKSRVVKVLDIKYVPAAKI